jgi:tetratricopeptide (TPR) repeat protein
LGLKPPREAYPLAEGFLEQAFAIDDELAEAHASRASIQMNFDYDFMAAEQGFKRALRRDPGNALFHQWYSLCLTVTGRMDEALAEIGQAMQLDPISPTVNGAAGRALCYARRYEASVEQLQKAIELDPHLALAHFYLGQTYTLQGKYDEALAAFNKALEIFNDFPWATSYVGHVYGLTGEREKARKILRKWEERGITLPVPTAVIYLGLGEDDKVFEWLEKGFEERDFLMPWINPMPDFDRLRSDPRYQDLMRRLGLSPQAQR